MDIQGNGAPQLNDVITTMLGLLEGDVLPNRARLASVRERPVGLANWRGVDVFGSIVPVALKGGRLDAGVFFEITRDLPDEADTAALELHGTLLAARDGLRAAGFLRIDGPDFSVPVEDQDTHVWRKTVTYRVLYEYQYRDVEGSASFITRIPARVDPEEGSPDHQVAVITGRVVRWQRKEEDKGIPAPPTLVVRGPTSIPGLTVAAFLPDVPGADVVLLRTFEGATGEPDTATSLQELATAEHIRRSAPLADFLNELTAPVPPDTVELADLAGNPGSYELRTFTFGPAIVLPRPIDRLEISTSAGAWDDSDAVLYLRAEGA
ncbi:MAG TPA: hypothetical protein VF179_14590 [Thermoanaerobaculia bacterium]|nr:hypothetical protein [Thermoanaerobaculia bacterium]